MEAQRNRARSARSQEGSMSVQSAVLQDIESPFEFVGYEQLSTNGTIKAIVISDELQQKLPAHSEGWVFFNRSTFYAEMGGQVADNGAVFDGEDMLAEVLDVKKAPNGQFMHKLRTLEMPLNIDQSYTLTVDRQSRIKTNQNHTATHLLHKALKVVLGEHASQAGSYVGPDRLRFDFSHFGKVTNDELKQIGNIVNYYIENAEDVNIAEMSIDAAKEMGAMALFGEKYGNIVRVVNIANESIELCGGTHVANTNEIGTFKLVSEAGIGAGIRRIEALTGQAAIADYQEKEHLLLNVQAQLKVQQLDQLTHKIEQIQDELKAANSKVDSLSAKLMQQESEDLFNDVKLVNDVSYIGLKVNNQSMDDLRNLGDVWRQKSSSNVLVLASAYEEKANLMILVDDETIAKGLKAGDLIKPLANLVGGGGGGRPQMAQAGGKNPAGIDNMLTAIEAEIAQRLS